MADVLIQNLDDAVVERYRRKANSAGMSLEAVLRELLIEHAPLSLEERMARMDRVRARMKPGGPTGAQLIRKDRDSR